MKAVLEKAMAGIDLTRTDMGETFDTIMAGEATPAQVAGHLYTAGMADPDLLIRTSGEMRISNFLLWQIAYTEIYVTDTLWPDFGRDEYLEIIRRFQQRSRRFGKVWE